MHTHTHARTPQPRVQAICAVNRAERVEPSFLFLSSAVKLRRRRRRQVRGEGMESQGLVYRWSLPARDGFSCLWQPLCPGSPGSRPSSTAEPPPSLPDPCLPWGTRQQAMIFPAAGPQTQMTLPQVRPTAPANPFGTTPMAMGLGSTLGLGHSGPCLSFATNPRQPGTNCFFPLSLRFPPHPVLIHTLNSPKQCWPFSGPMCSTKPQHMDPLQATTSLPASECPRLGRLRKSHLQEAHNSSK